MEQLLEVKGLSTSFLLDGEEVKVVDDVSFVLAPGEALGIVGESGSGKSVTAKTVLRLIPSPPGKVLSGEILFQGEDLLKIPMNKMRRIRGNKISMIFQEPMTSLNPVFTCGNQIGESMILHQGVPKKQVLRRAAEMMKLVGIQDSGIRVKAYPHELSGGMRQRVMIAMALACEPALLIADEPTTALDPTIQAQILELIQSLRRKSNMAVMLITHDLGIVAGHCDTVIVMYAGTIMEKAPVKALFKQPAHPYTSGLLKAMPMIHKKRERLDTIEGIVPSFSKMPAGCPFYPRCPKADGLCIRQRPPLAPLGAERSVRCWHPNEQGEL
ncbi:MAG: ABC transporter ATP-binding protein [Candidatus Limiplasma sp.]|nr:ABC transporter ATP-binding protein [Candidatus Limiplasma sp.]